MQYVSTCSMYAPHGVACLFLGLTLGWSGGPKELHYYWGRVDVSSTVYVLNRVVGCASGCYILAWHVARRRRI